MRRAGWLTLWLLLAGCATHAVHCDGALRAINSPSAQLSAVSPAKRP